MSQTKHGLSVLYLAIFLLSLTGLFAKLIPLNSISIIPLRAVVASGGLLLFGLLQKRRLRLGSYQNYAGIYLLGVFLGIHWVTFFHAMQVSSVAVGMLAMFSFPVITILLEPIFSKSPLQGKDIIAGLVVVAGLTVMVGEDLSSWQGPIVQGVLWGVISAVLFSLRNLWQKYRFAQVSSDALMFHQVLAVALLLVVFIDIPAVSQLQPPDWLNLVLLGLISTATAHTLLSYCLKQLTAKSVALISCLQPLLAAILAWLVLGEVPGLSVVLGGSIILGVVLYETLQKTAR